MVPSLEPRDYTVRLESVFQGPMDLLLHLVREQEVDIHEIEINRVIEGYLRYLRELEQIDVEIASDFVVMAATLMAIKSRSLLPREELVDLEKELDPRDELIRRLVEYRRFKQASRDLERRAAERARLHPRGSASEDGGGPELDLSELSRWDLLSVFSRLMRETQGRGPLRIQSDERPLRFYVEQLVGWLKSERQTTLRALVRRSAGSGDRGQLVGSFCALLELVKLGVARAWQQGPASDIAIALREDALADVDVLVRAAGLADEDLEGAGEAALAERGAAGASPRHPAAAARGPSEDPLRGDGRRGDRAHNHPLPKPSETAAPPRTKTP